MATSRKSARAGRTPSPPAPKIVPTETFLPPRLTLPALRRASAACRGCPLYLHATQAVFGEGGANALVMLVGEQPGDREDRTGRPFVGPTGRLLDEAIAEAGLKRAEVYVTNVVKHFNFEPRVVVLLGATAAQALLGARFRITRERGKVFEHSLGPAMIATFHPSAILRAPDETARAQGRAALVADLSLAARRAHEKVRKA